MIKFSIIIPAYNVENYIEECLNSIIKQKFDNYEIILIDDGSTDNTRGICEKYVSKYSDKIIFFSQKNRGQSFTRNKAEYSCAAEPPVRGGVSHLSRRNEPL